MHWTAVQQMVGAAVWMLGDKHGFSAQAAKALEH